MLNALLSIVPKEDGNFYFESFGEALIYALIGFLVVFLGIVLIIFIIWLVGLIIRKTNNFEFLTKLKIKKKVKEKEVQPTETEAEVPDEIKAVITAVIMTYYSEQKPECEFKVKRIKRI